MQQEGFTVRQRVSTQTVDSLAATDGLLGEPYHNVVDFFAENSGNRFNLGSVSIVGPYRYNGVFDGEFGTHDRRRWAIRAAEDDAFYSNYDKNNDDQITEDELIVIVVASQSGGDYHRYTLRLISDFEEDSFQRSTRTDPASGRTFDVLTGRLVGTQTTADYQHQFYAHDDVPAKSQWTHYEASIHVFPLGQGTPIADVAYGEPIVITSADHGLSTGDLVHIRNVPGIEGGKYNFSITKLDEDRFELNESKGSGTYSSGGSWFWGNIFKGGPGGATRNLREDVVLVGATFSADFQAAGIENRGDFMTFVHEISHVLEKLAAVPNEDLYNFQANNLSAGINDYAAMGATGRLDGTFHHDPWTKEKFGWVDPIVITGPVTVRLQDSATSGQILKIPRNSNEYFLVENRWGGSSYDAISTAQNDTVGLPGTGIPDQGLAIWHVDLTRQGKPAEQLPTVLWKEDAGRDAWAAIPHGNPGNDLWQNGQSFDAVSDEASATVPVPANSNWNDGTVSDIVIRPLSLPGPEMLVEIDFTGVPRDRLESNDCLDTAYDLGQGNRVETGLTIHEPGNDDYYRWTAPASGIRSSACSESGATIRPSDSGSWATTLG